jgi:hypothetical protein
MPLVRSNTVGGKIIASAKITRRYPLAVAAGTTSNVNLTSLQVSNLPHCFYYVQVTAGPPGCTFTPQFAPDNQVAGGAVVPRWFDVTPAQLLVVGVPALISQKLITNMIGVFVTVPGGGAAATVTVILAASI